MTAANQRRAAYGDDYIGRDCECGHGEHRGACLRNHLTYYPAGQAVPPSARPAFTHTRAALAGIQAYWVPCSCAGFREYEGPSEPPDL